MKNRKIWRLSGVLSEKEKAHFLRFLKVELEERQAFLQKLARLIMATHPHDLTDEGVWQALYPDKPYDDARLRKISRDLTYWLEEYLAIEGFRRNRGQRDLFLLRELENRQCREDFVKTYNRVEKNWEGRFREVDLNDQYLMKYQMEIEKQNFIAGNRSNLKILKGFKSSHKAISDVNNLVDVTDAFMNFWVIQSISLAMDPSIRKNSHDHPNLRLFHNVTNEIKAYSFEKVDDRINLFHRLFAPSLDRNPDFFEDTFRKFQEKHNEFSNSDLETALIILFNYFQVERIKTGKQENINLQLEILIWGVNEGILLKEGTLNAYYYRNIVNLFIQKKDYSKAQHYLEEFAPLLNSDERHEAFYMGVISILNANNQHDQIISFLKDKTFKNPRYELDARLKLVQSQFEVDPQAEIWIITQISNLQKYVRNKKGLPQNLKDQYLLFLRYFKLLVQASTPKKISQLEMRLENSSFIPNRAWLREKIAQKST